MIPPRRRTLTLARDGTEIVITDRGKPIARIVPDGRRDRLQELIELGLAAPPEQAKAKASGRKRIPVNESVSDLVIEQRR